MKIDTDDVTVILSRVKLLQDFDAEIIRDIADKVRIVEFDKDQFLVKQGHVNENLYFICEGEVEVEIPDANGALQKSVILRKGAVIGEISLLVNSAYTVNIVTRSQTTALLLDRKHFKQMVNKHKVFAEVMSNLMTSRMGQSGGINKVGKYELLGKLGEGSMATVFNAYDSELEREVAIKMLKYHLAFDPDFVRRFKQEARIIASLSHPNIVNVYEVISEYSTNFIVMEKLPGQNLAQIQKEKGPFSLPETRSILLQLAGALQYAHNLGSEGIVHRDIKPSNIVLDENGIIKLTDFGVAGPPRDKDVNIEGTPSYLAPEIINSEAVDNRADIYSLGVTAFRMLTGRLPFSAPSLAELLQKQVNQSAPDIRAEYPDIDESLARFIKGALAKNRGDRISDWNQIRDILKPVPQPLAANEAKLVVWIRDSPQDKTQQVVQAIQKILLDEDLNYSLELHRSSDSE
ncbi:MAG: protein kinase [Gammaproteobacteria bacterium]|nr:protein kinase [Gammaproteobacteria bacterium]